MLLAELESRHFIQESTYI